MFQYILYIAHGTLTSEQVACLSDLDDSNILLIRSIKSKTAIQCEQFHKNIGRPVNISMQISTCKSI